MNSNKEVTGEQTLARVMNYKELDKAFAQVSQELDVVTAQRDELLAALKDAIAFIEMKLAHNGAQSVDSILHELGNVGKISHVTTSHHVGCSQTTRSVNLQSARAAIARAEGRGE